MGTELNRRVDRVRVEYEVGGQARTVELSATDDHPIILNLQVENEVRELPPDKAWREYEPTGRALITLDASGPLTPRKVEG